MSLAKITLEAEMPYAHVQSFLQAVRAWEDDGHKDAQVAIKIDAVEMDARSAEEIFKSLDPAFERVIKIANEGTYGEC